MGDKLWPGQSVIMNNRQYKEFININNLHQLDKIFVLNICQIFDGKLHTRKGESMQLIRG